jgi:hypothetical protein
MPAKATIPYLVSRSSRFPMHHLMLKSCKRTNYCKLLNGKASLLFSIACIFLDDCPDIVSRKDVRPDMSTARDLLIAF